MIIYGLSNYSHQRRIHNKRPYKKWFIKRGSNMAYRIYDVRQRLAVLVHLGQRFVHLEHTVVDHQHQFDVRRLPVGVVRAADHLVTGGSGSYALAGIIYVYYIEQNIVSLRNYIFFCKLIHNNLTFTL